MRGRNVRFEMRRYRRNDIKNYKKRNVERTIDADGKTLKNFLCNTMNFQFYDLFQIPFIYSLDRSILISKLHRLTAVASFLITRFEVYQTSVISHTVCV